MTRTPTPIRTLFPDWREMLDRAEGVQTKPIRECFVCGAKASSMRRMDTKDEWQCWADADCGRRAMKREWA